MQMKFYLLLTSLYLSVSAAVHPFANDECSDAKVIPSASLKYTEIVDIANYTNNRADPLLSCSFFKDRENITDGKTFWYKFIPPTDGLLSVLTSNLIRPWFGRDLDLIVGVFEGSCGNQTEIACIDGEFVNEYLYRTVREGVTYYIKVGEASDIRSFGRGTFNFTAVFDPSNLTVVGDEFTDAKVISHSSLPYNEIVDTRYYSNNPNDIINSCNYGNEGHTVWFQYTPAFNGLMVVSTVGSDEVNNNFTLLSTIGAFTGKCDNLTQVFCVEQSTAETLYYPVRSGVTYTIKVGESGDSAFGLGLLNFSLSLQRNYFNLVESPSANVIGVLNDVFNGAYSSLVPANTIDYAQISTSSLAISVEFSRPTAVRSALLKLNGGKAVCDSSKPYTLSGPFALGNRLVTAKGYSRPNCQGNVVANIAQSFSVKACNFLQYSLYDANRNTYVTNLHNASTVSSPPCNMNIGVTFECGFVPGNVRLELRRASNNALVSRRDEKEEPYFLFGDRNGNIFAGSVPAGEYILSARIDGVFHPSVRFTLGACQRNDLIVDNSFDIDLRFELGYGSTYEIAKLFSPVLKRISSMVIGDSPDFVNTTALAGITDFFCGNFPSRIDDLHICTSLYDQDDGVDGILGFLSNTYVRQSTKLPFTGTIIFDTVDFNKLLETEKVEPLILQLFILTLGLGEYWDDFNLASRTAPCRYNGTKAVSEFNAITGCSSDTIPLETNLAASLSGFTRFNCLYWDSTCLKNEVLTYSLGEKKVSRITLGSLEDLGYTVNYTAADPYGIDDIGTCGCNTGTRALRASTEHKDEESLVSASSCHQGKVYDRAVIHGRKMLKKLHDHHLKQMEYTSLPDDIEFVGHKSITVAYMHEDGTLCSAIVRPPV